MLGRDISSAISSTLVALSRQNVIRLQHELASSWTRYVCLSSNANLA